MITSNRCIPVLLVAFLFFLGRDALGDDLFMASGRKLKSAQRAFIENRVKGLRDSDYHKRFETIQYLVGLDRIAVPYLVEEVEKGSNPMPIRCALLALAEIGGPEAVRVLENVLTDSDLGRDERTVAALGLGKIDASFDLSALRELVDPGENRLVRKAAAMALARRGDKDAAPGLLDLGLDEREDELSSIFLLSAFMIGGEGVIQAVPDLFKSSRANPQVLVLGCALLGDPILLPVLLKEGERQEKLKAALVKCLGRFRSADAVAYLSKAALGSDQRTAIDALYSLVRQGGKEADEVLSRILDTPRPAAVKAHALLALADAGKVPSWTHRIHQVLKSPEAEVRSAAALALRLSIDPETPLRLSEILKIEKRADVVADILLCLGLLGGGQYLEAAEDWAASKQFPETARLAGLVSKVFKGKTDPRILEERYEDRIRKLRARWRFRFCDGIMAEVFRDFELDRIVRKDGTDSSGGGEDSGAGEDDSTSDDEGLDAGDSGEGSDGSRDPGQSTLSNSGLTAQKKFQFRNEVLEWDLYQWFRNYPYFPEGFFTDQR